ncbi:MAG: hydroxyacid dehydrogenase [Candidatus Hodarchaeota archaeon]
MKKKFRVFIPEPEWEKSLAALEEIAEVKTGVPNLIYTESQLVKEIKNIDALIITSQHHVTRKVIEAAKKLKVIVKYGSKPGIDTVDLEAATEKGIPVCYTPEANSDSVAEHTIALILALLKRINVTSFQLREGKWRDKNLLGYELLGKKVGIIGLGKIGYKVAERIRGFQAKLLAYDPYVSENRAKQVKVKLTDLETLLRESDIVTIHAALNEETVHLIGEQELGLLKKSAFMVNTARGAIIDEKALIKALERGWIAGAALDVFEEEPPKSDNPLLEMSNIIVTPHSASCTYEAYQREAFMAVEEVLRVLNGNKPRFVANPEKFLERKNIKPKKNKLISARIPRYRKC